jgi:NADPH:quinone reductase-like Zn-dependent oxidoreductase
MLAGLTRVIKPHGNITVCGNAGGIELATTVMPFIIRGVNLLGVASGGTARKIREEVWEHLAGDWKPMHLDRIAAKEVALDEIPGVFSTMLAGGAVGRTVVRLG